MTLHVHHVVPVVSIIAGILILVQPRLLNYIVAIYLILAGLLGWASCRPERRAAFPFVARRHSPERKRALAGRSAG